ncbi:MAG TPA: CdaR family protein, partial [Oceanobacillus sp.]|nr:CdaR family protein [Oceanobacillus sp.]
LRNVAWFLLSLVLAILVWVTAVSQSNPFEERRMPGIPLRVNQAPGLVIVNEASLPQTVTVRLIGQRSEITMLTQDDVVVTANLADLGPGTHTVPLVGTAARGARVDTVIPSQITVDLEVIASQLVEVRPRIINPPPPDTEAGEPELDVLQVEVSGPQSLVQQVSAAEVTIDLEGQRTTFEDDVRPIPVDAEGDPVENVTVSPQVVHVTIPISESETVREVNVSPVTEGELPDGYFIRGINYEPQTVYLSVPAGSSADIPQTLPTVPIVITGRTDDFEETVPLDLSGLDVIPISESNITVTILIDAQTATRQLERVPVEQIGGDPSFQYRIEPSEVTLIITAPQPLVERLTRDDVRVTADVSAMRAAGTYNVTPTATLREPAEDVNITILPAQMVVVVESSSATPRATSTSDSDD